MGESLLLGKGDPAPFEICNEAGQAEALLICDHASSAMPATLGDLGLDAGERRRHIAWDIGIAEVTRGLATRLDTVAILSGYSRLVIDCNRQLDDPTSIPQESDNVVVPGNRGLSAAQRAERARSCFWPYQKAIAACLERKQAEGQIPIVISMHSFTPVMDGFERPWHIGILSNHDRRIAGPLLEALRADRTIAVGDNQPYDGRLGRGFGMMVHGEGTGLPFALIELRQDQIDTHHGAEAWASRLAPVLGRIFANAALRKPAA